MDKMKIFTLIILVSLVFWECGNEKGTNSTVSGGSAWSSGDTLIDSRDGQKYATVQIGSQCWMAENLNVGVYVPSEHTGIRHSDVSDNDIIEKYAYNNDTTNLAIYGGLYDWNEAMAYSSAEGGQGICPNGWHMPTDAELDTLVNAAGGAVTAAPVLKAGGSSGFQALLAGLRFSSGIFNYMGVYTCIWSSSQHDAVYPHYLILWYVGTDANRSYDIKTTGYCVRCVKD